MRNLGVFYLILMILLSVAPCGDEQESQDFVNNTIAKIEHGKSSGSEESCSPICLCTCCGQSIVVAVLGTFDIKVPILEIDHTIKNHQSLLGLNPHNIWQPPKTAKYVNYHAELV